MVLPAPKDINTSPQPITELRDMPALVVKFTLTFGPEQKEVMILGATH